MRKRKLVKLKTQKLRRVVHVEAEMNALRSEDEYQRHGQWDRTELKIDRMIRQNRMRAHANTQKVESLEESDSKTFDSGEENSRHYRMSVVDDDSWMTGATLANCSFLRADDGAAR